MENKWHLFSNKHYIFCNKWLLRAHTRIIAILTLYVPLLTLLTPKEQRIFLRWGAEGSGGAPLFHDSLLPRASPICHINYLSIQLSPHKSVRTPLSEIFGDAGVVEVVHLVHHTDGGVDDGESAEGTSAFTKTEAKME